MLEQNVRENPIFKFECIASLQHVLNSMKARRAKGMSLSVPTVQDALILRCFAMEIGIVGE